MLLRVIYLLLEKMIKRKKKGAAFAGGF